MDLLKQMWKKRIGYYFIAPSMVVFIIFVLVPLIWTLLLTFQSGDLLSMRPTGLANYREVLQDDLFLLTLKNTASYALFAVPTVIILSLFLAVCLHNVLNKFFQNMFKSVIFFPLLAPMIITALIWQAVYHPQGILNELRALVDLQPLYWLGDPRLALKSIAAVEIWRGSGLYVIVFLAALQGIPRELYEAASIDGSSGFKTFWNITLPQLKPSLMFSCVMATIWNFQLFDSVYILTSGGPAYRSSTIVWYIYQNAFHHGQVGYAATMALFLMLIIMLLSILQMRALKND